MCEGLPRREEKPDIGIADFVDEMVAAIVNVRIYHKEHPRVASSVTELLRLHEELLGKSKRGSLVLSTVDDFLVYEGRPLLGPSMAANKIIRPLASRSSGGIELERDVTAHDLQELLAMLADRVREGDDVEAFNERLKERGCHNVSILPPFMYGQRTTRSAGGGIGADGDLNDGSASDIAKEFMVPVQLYQRIVDCLQSATISICQRGRLDMDEVSKVAKELLKPLAQNAGGVLSMARYERYDAFTYGHSIRVCALALNFVRTLTDDEDLLLDMAVAGLLHDVGKSKIPFDILHHRGPLTPEMRLEMEKHPALGADILLDHDGISDLPVAVTFGHHRTTDGGGYPRDVLDVKLSRITKIIKICDVYEALTSVRPYKDAVVPTRAYRIMLSMDNHFDPVLLRRFIETNGIYSTGGRVRLDDGTIARVTRQTSNLRRPVVQLERHACGEEFAEKDRVELDLSREAGSRRFVAEGIFDEAFVPG